MRCASILWRLLCVPSCAALAACGGVDHGNRPSAQRQIDGNPVDECSLAQGLEFLNILSFEPSQRSTDLCDNSTSCVNLNYDQGSANRCDVGWTVVDPSNPDRDVCPVGHFVNDSPRDCKNFTKITCFAADGSEYPDDMSAQPSASNYCVTHSSTVPATAPVQRCGQTSQAVHVQGQNLAICYSPRSHKPGWGGNYRITITHDASDWDGVSFWAKKGDGPTGTGLLPHILDPYTIGTGNPPCSTSAKETEPDQAKCDPFGLSAVLQDDWRFYKMPFADVRQKGFGMASPLGEIDKTAISAVEFTFNAGDWDFWIDDVAFYRDQR